MKGLLVALAAVVLAIPTAAVSADRNAADRFSDEAYFGAPETPSWWQLWGSASLGFEYYETNENYEDYSVNGSADVVFKAPTGFNVGVGIGGAAYGATDNQDYVSGVANLKLFYASPEFAVGAYAGTYATNNDFESAWVGVEAAKFFSQIDIGAYALVNGYRVGDPIYAVGGWMKGYLTANTLLAAAYEYDWNNDDGGQYHFLDARAEHRFKGTSLGAYAEAEYSWTDWGFQSWDLFGGVTFYFGPKGSTLQDYQRAANPFYWECCW